MKASAFEFRHRSLIITAIFVLSFSLYALGDESLVLTVLAWLKRWPSIPPAGAARARQALRAALRFAPAVTPAPASSPSWPRTEGGPSAGLSQFLLLPPEGSASRGEEEGSR